MKTLRILSKLIVDYGLRVFPTSWLIVVPIISIIVTNQIGLNGLVLASNSTQTVASNSLHLTERASHFSSRTQPSASQAASTVATANALSQSNIGYPMNGNGGGNPNILHHSQAQQQHNQPAIQINQSNQAAQAAIVSQHQQQSQIQQQQLQQPLQQQQQNQQHQQNQAGPSTSSPTHQQSLSQTPNQNINTNFNNLQAQQIGQLSGPISQTPVLSTTFALNPLTGQFVPTDLSTSFLTNTNYLGPPSQGANLPVYPSNPLQATKNQPYYGNIGGQQQRFATSISSNQFNRRTSYPVSSSSIVPLRNSGVVYQNQQSQQANGLNNFLDTDDTLFQNQLNNNNNNNNLINLIGTNELASLANGNIGLSNANSFQSINGLSSINQQQSGFNNFDQLQQSNLAQQSYLTGSQSNGEYRYSDQCLAADNRHGTCYQASECIRRGGTPMGRCGPSAGSIDFSGNSYVCCIFDVTCGQFAAERFVYFRNPNYPATFDQSRMCRARIGKLDKGICQFRLDLLRFDVAKPANGNCSQDMFVVSGQNENYVIPKICGFNDGQHYYVGVDESGVITLHLMMRGFYRRSFEILVTQIPCKSDYSAPSHCLQYFVGTHGTIKSFNYEEGDQINQSFNPTSSYNDLLPDGNSLSLAASAPNGLPSAPYGLHISGNQPNSFQQQRLQQHQNFISRFGNLHSSGYNQQEQFAGYPNDLDYTMCVKKESGFCSITYQLSRSEQGLQEPFAVGQTNNLFSQPNDSLWQQQQLSTECRDDYLLIGGVRLCSGAGTNSLNANGPLSSNTGNNIDINSPLFVNNGTLQNQSLLQQLQNQYNQLMQELTRLQQQQQAGNGTFVNNDNLQQQAVISQQANSILQQHQTLLAILGGNGANSVRQPQGPSQLDIGFHRPDGYGSHGSIITDSTSGPFILRFVSNFARNAKGFHIDYRQNPCK